MSELAEDWKEHRENQKKVRDLRQESFEKDVLPRLKVKYEVFTGSNCQYIIDSHLGVIDYFPKSKKLLQREGNNWHSDGLSWIIKNLL